MMDTDPTSELSGYCGQQSRCEPVSFIFCLFVFCGFYLFCCWWCVFFVCVFFLGGGGGGK